MRTLAIRTLAVCAQPSTYHLAGRADRVDERVIRCAFC